MVELSLLQDVLDALCLCSVGCQRFHSQQDLLTGLIQRLQNIALVTALAARQEVSLLERFCRHILHVTDQACREVLANHLHQSQRFDVNCLGVILKENLISGEDFLFGEDLVLRKEVKRLLGDEVRHRILRAASSTHSSV